MAFDLVDKEGTKSGKGLGWSWFGLNDGKRDAKILRELGKIYKEGGDYVYIFNQKNPQTPITRHLWIISEIASFNNWRRQPDLNW